MAQGNTSDTSSRLPRKGDVLELVVDSLSYGGKGVARQEGFVIFIPHTLPGQRVQAQVTKRRKGFAEARVVEIVESSPDSIEPKCVHFGICGGCATQNYPYPKQLEQKQDQVRDLFVRMGGFRDVEVQPIIGCQETYHYRNKMEFTFSSRPWVIDLEHPGEFPSQALGLHVPGRFDKVLDIRECRLQHPVADDVFRWVKEKVEQLGLEPYDIKTHTGFLRHLVIRAAGTAGQNLEVMVNLVTSREEPQPLKVLADELMVAFPDVKSVVNNINTRKAAVAYGEWEIVLAGKSTITDHVRGLNFDISANSFFQTNSAQAAVLYDQVERACAFEGGEVVYDLYCGTGTIALMLAGAVQEAVGFESVSSAVEDATRNAMLNEIYNVRFFHADLSTRYFTREGARLQRQVPPPDIIVIDPPRAGMHPKLVEEVMTMAPGKVVYVSCNPATQVRDIRPLVAQGYRLTLVQPVDMFPHTPHIENICVLER